MAIASAVSVARYFEVHHYTGEDGYPAADVFDVAYIDLADGRSFYLPCGVRRVADDEGFGGYGYRARYEAAVMAARVEAAGNVVDLDHWVEVEDFDLEAELEAEFYREAEDRFDHTGSYFG